MCFLFHTLNFTNVLSVGQQCEINYWEKLMILGLGVICSVWCICMIL